jgi:hypothetical protein
MKRKLEAALPRADAGRGEVLERIVVRGLAQSCVITVNASTFFSGLFSVRSPLQTSG